MIKKYLPKSLFGRFFLIIAVPVIISQFFVTYMFYHRHWQHVTKHMTKSFASEIAVVVELLVSENTKENENLIKHIKKNLYLYGSLKKGNKFHKHQNEVVNSLKVLEQEIKLRLKSSFNLYYLDGRSFIKIEIDSPDGVIEITASRKRIANTTTNIFIAWMVGSNMLLLILTILFMRNQIKPIARLAWVAEKFGRGVSINQFKPEGAFEVRKVALAFIKMKARIERHISQRTEMLASISHDIRTPLTRIKLQMELMNSSKEIDEIAEEINEIEHMINSYLTFAKEQFSNEESKLLDLSGLIRKLINTYQKQKHRIKDNIQPNVKLDLRPIAFKRALTNIIDNGLQFGNLVEVKLLKTHHKVILEISDNGPGVAKNQYDEIFKPFARVESSRNQETGGVGLGLATAKDVVNFHGGEIEALSSKLGGLTIKITLPI